MHVSPLISLASVVAIAHAFPVTGPRALIQSDTAGCETSGLLNVLNCVDADVDVNLLNGGLLPTEKDDMDDSSAPQPSPEDSNPSGNDGCRTSGLINALNCVDVDVDASLLNGIAAREKRDGWEDRVTPAGSTSPGTAPRAPTDPPAETTPADSTPPVSTDPPAGDDSPTGITSNCESAGLINVANCLGIDVGVNILNKE
ncbi:uncharacterized protein HMPREF1541_05821 [Cyphellophora europaea CBS 101466]|uniref:Hydrophobin n=1 Tax=Cyphellophora europaea (strain CBS 101466) TaxID=1220924 RepID=W2RTF1_CYPE1|nr:uncharacterized protein HMPREF1541_05821 [Cyphellophora europaea CBS 101466]ETN39595.1 hypothetical protein HMPREF1541_05821 [Cyphellophora europaea CBS 101466]